MQDHGVYYYEATGHTRLQGIQDFLMHDHGVYYYEATGHTILDFSRIVLVVQGDNMSLEELPVYFE
jgi:hypothetical protein